MPGCILHVCGKDFKPREVLSRITLAPYSVYNRGDERFPGSSSGKLHEAGGFKCDASKIDSDLSAQAHDAISFLNQHYAALRQLASDPTIEHKYLDFGYYCRIDEKTCVAQFDHLPADLLRLCGELGLGIELSLYPRPSDEPDFAAT